MKTCQLYLGLFLAAVISCQQTSEPKFIEVPIKELVQRIETYAFANLDSIEARRVIQQVSSFVASTDDTKFVKCWNDGFCFCTGDSHCAAFKIMCKAAGDVADCGSSTNTDELCTCKLPSQEQP